MLNEIMCCVILAHNLLEFGTTHELMMHTRFEKSEEPHIWSEFTPKRTTRMHQFFSASSVLLFWVLCERNARKVLLRMYEKYYGSETM